MRVLYFAIFQNKSNMTALWVQLHKVVMDIISTLNIDTKFVPLQSALLISNAAPFSSVVIEPSV